MGSKSSKSYVLIEVFFQHFWSGCGFSAVLLVFPEDQAYNEPLTGALTSLFKVKQMISPHLKSLVI